MYRQPAKPAEDAVLFTCTTGVSPMVPALLAAGALLVIGLGAQAHALWKGLMGALPFIALGFGTLAARRTTLVTSQTLRSRRFFGTRTFPLDAVVRLAVPHASAGALAATSDSRLAAGLLLWDAKGAFFAVPAQVPNAILRGIVATALPPALRHAEDLIAAGGRYMDADGFSALDPTSLHGKSIGLLAPVPHAAKLETVVRVNGDGRVELGHGPSFLIAAQDLVMCELLRKRGVTVDVPMALSELM